MDDDAGQEKVEEGEVRPSHETQGRNREMEEVEGYYYVFP